MRPDLAPALALAALLASAAAPAAAAELGKLFHTPEERAQLDQRRRGEPEVAPAAAAAKPRVTGFVRRSDGRNTVWINGVPVAVADPRADRLLEPRALNGGDEHGRVKVERGAGGVKR